MKNGADFVATGHYARLKTQDSKLKTQDLRLKKKNTTKYFLSRGRDLSKDQSYFLWTLNQKQLEKIIFPVGDLLKSEIREIAKENNLWTASKKDSQGLCFIGKIAIKDFLHEFIKNKKGNIVDLETNQKIGEHAGVFFYTIGEKIHNKFIIRKDLQKNILYVKDTMELKVKTEIILENINFTQDLKVGETYEIQERYHAKLSKIKILAIKKIKQELKLKYKLISKENFVYTEGQSLVFYKRSTLIGGGIMK